MQEALRALNELVAQGVIADYAIGGAVAAAFYISAAETEDVDAFVMLQDAASGIVLLSPIYAALTALGGVIEGQYVRFGKWPIQILTDGNPLLAEAIREALQVEYNGTPTRVFRPEHVCAVALQTGRTKDYLRVTMFLEQKSVDTALLRAVLFRHHIAVPALLAELQPGRKADA